MKKAQAVLSEAIEFIRGVGIGKYPAWASWASALAINVKERAKREGDRRRIFFVDM